MKKKDKGYDFSTEAVERKRKFPILGTFALCITILIQVVCVVIICVYRPEPQDIIEDYTIYATPQADGSLNIKYCFTWTPIDTTEDLTWVEIGMANEYFTILAERSDNIREIFHYADDEGYCYAQVYFDRPYQSGETLYFYFTVNQRRVLATDGVETFYEFVPGWFNYTPVNHYAFYFAKHGDISSHNGDAADSEWMKWEGYLECGDFVKMRVNYNSFDAHAVSYEPFYEDDCYDGLYTDTAEVIVFLVLFICFLVIIEISIIDAYVSYNRGRGFLRGYGHPVHVYGHVNPRYKSEADKHSGSYGGGGGRGCACACACACAGGGRAGCSQKDTYHNKQ